MVMVMVVMVVMVMMILSASILSTTFNQSLAQRAQTDKLIGEQLIKGVHAGDYASYDVGSFPLTLNTRAVPFAIQNNNGDLKTYTVRTTVVGAPPNNPNQQVTYSVQ